MRTESHKIIFCLIILFVSLVADVASEECSNVKETTIVKTKAGLLEGKIVDNLGVHYHSFKGIPYAEPPIGKYRFQAAVPHKKWRGVRNAFEHGNYCLVRPDLTGQPTMISGHEDCLFLNVYTPSTFGKRPVMFWIHGGSFLTGNGDSTFYGPEHLMKEDVVLVTINYRLSAFGFLSTGDKHAPGNQGLKDIVLALKWVQENIKNFGGDPKKVTIFGQSAGSAAVHYLLISDLANGLFNKAIMMSGTSLMTTLFQPDPMAQADKLAKRLKITYSSTKELVEKLTAIDFQKIVDVEAPLFSMDNFVGLRPLEFVPCVEPKNTKNAFLKETPTKKMIHGNYKKIPLLVGGTNFEAMFVAAIFAASAQVIPFFNKNPYFMVPVSWELNENSPNIVEAIKNLQNMYFNGRTEGTLEEWLQVISDLIFNTPSDRVVRFYTSRKYPPIYYYEFAFDGSLNFFKKSFSLDSFEGASHSDDLFYLFEPAIPGFIPDENSSLIRNRMVKMWTNFAKYGNPTPKKDSLITEVWKPYTASERSYFVIDEVLENRSHRPRMDVISDLHLKYTGHF